MPKKPKGYDFEKALSDLEQLVERMENGDFSLEESLQAFEQGIKLTRECQRMLAQAEQKVQILIQGEDKIKLEPFESTE
ncbi:MAG: exodeoxyribonuclease VII small subunit [Pseudomonadales bacterium]|nr:exodeoxyribonuclease VII small subunit [Pseudomonadales bacterium]MCP5213738.1 exodeoxyribonuclease VII small subunit [Pseudomonadales bacterium]